MTFFQKKAVCSPKSDSGFTVIELMVTLGIVVLVTGIVMLQYSSFNSSVLLTSQAYITAFDIRETQSLAVSVRGRTDEFREEYGLYFAINAPDRYLLFQDNDTNGEHNPARYHEGEEIGSPFRVDPRFDIIDLCATNNNVRTCGLVDLSITFERPDFDAGLYSSDMGSNMQSVEIIYGTEGGSIDKSVMVYASGQISVE